MIPAHRIVLAAAFVLAAWSCTPPCETVSPAPQLVCHRADAGAIAPNAPFVLEGQTFVRNGSCVVTIDGGQINLAVDGMSCVAPSGGGTAAPTSRAVVPCQIPALDAGTYVVNSVTPVTFTIPESPDAGVPSCL